MLRPVVHRVLHESLVAGVQRVSPKQVAKKYIMENLKKGFITPSKDNPFAFPILFVKKANKGLQMCVNYRLLNEVTQKDTYPLPLIDEILPCLLKAKIMTKD